MKKTILAVIFAATLSSTAMAGIQPKFDEFMKRYNTISSSLEKKKASLKPAEYNKYSNELEASRQKMYNGAGSMDRGTYYGMADGEFKKLDQIESKLK